MKKHVNYKIGGTTVKNIINTIKFLFWACVVTLGLTYVISLFDKWFNLEWLPNPFLLSISSGVFASLFVLFVMELKKYFEAKTSSINFIYYNCLSLYSDLWIQICHIDMLLEKQDEQVTNRLLEFRQPYIVQATHNLRAVDYKVLKKRKTLEQGISNFQNSQISQIDDYVRMCAYLPLSINKTQLNAATNGYLHYNATASDPLVATALQKIKAKASLIMDAINTLMDTIATSNKSYNWENQKAIILSSKPLFEEIKKQEEKFFNE